MLLPGLDRIERLLIWLLAGFLFWPHAVSSIVLVLLLAIRVYRERSAILPKGTNLLLLMPAAIVLAAWITHGAVANGRAEVQLMGIWIASALYFGKSPFRVELQTSFVILSIIQAVGSVIWMLAIADITAFSTIQTIRDTLGAGLKVHPTYMSAIWLWAAFLLLRKNKVKMPWRLGGAALLVVPALLAGGRMPLLALAGLLVLWVLYEWWSKKRLSWSIAAVLLTIILSLAILPKATERLSEIKNINIAFSDGHWLSSTELRLGVWQCTIDIIRENWVFGVGTGNTREALEVCYKTLGNSQFFSTEFNSHNQYLHFWLIGGIGAFLMFVGFWGWMMIIAWRQKSSTALFFLLYAGAIMLTENYFSRQSGILFSALMLFSLLPQATHQPSGAKHSAK